MTTEEIKKILQRYNKGQCTEVEKAIIEEVLMQFTEGDVDISTERIEEIGEHIYKQLPGPGKGAREFSLWPVIAIVAAISTITISTWLYYDARPPIRDEDKVVDIVPGGNKATLTLPNGKVINLSADQKRVIVQPDKLTYSDGTEIVNSLGSRYNGEGTQTISTPKGGQYEIVLPDGTKVWLNAATTLQFSANLKRERGERKVWLESGEAYFEVFKDKKRPFVVATRQQQVTVLGTHFNIEAYDVKNIKTTLLEGAVKVSSKLNSEAQTVVLKPGEQSKYISKKLTQGPADVNLAVAWKRGKIVFKDADLKSIMLTLERWYNIEAVYQSYPSESRFSGSVSRSKNISEVLHLIESTQEVHFKIEERRVLIMR